MRLTLGAAIAGGLLCVACSSGGDADPVDSTAGTATTVEPVATTEPAGTQPPGTAPTTEPPAPPTTEQSTESLIAEIEADLNAGEQAVLAAAGAPDDPRLRAGLARYFTGEALDRLHLTLDQLAADGLIARANPDVESIVRVRRILGSNSSGVNVEFCRVDAATVVDPQPDGGEAIVDDDVVAYEIRLTVIDQAGVWVSPGDGERLSERPGGTSCDE